MKKKALIISSVCSVFFGSTAAFADGDTFAEPSIEKPEKKFTAGTHPHPIFSWNSPIMPVSNVLHPGSARGAGMVEAPLLEIDTIMNTAISDKVMPGAVAFAARGGHIVKNKAYGYAVRYLDGSFTESPNPIQMQENTIFDLASISKIFTSTAFMVLYEKGLIKLDDPVMNYIPEFAQNGKEHVTVRQLLTHTSGFVSWIPLYSKGSSREDRMRLVFSQALQNQPGTKYTYSDLNMITLGAIIERISGMRQDEFVKKYITDPLEMKDTMYNPPASLKNRIAATEYQKVPNRGLVWGQVHDENAWSLDGVAGHAGVFSTASDLAKLAHIFLNEGRYGGKRILDPETVKLLLENQNQAFPGNDHGLGWELGQGWYMDALSDGSSFGHTGYTGTSIVVNPKLKTIAILLTNRVHPTRATVSTNQTRRLFARQVADAIPVAIPGKKSAWFSGYGDNQTKILEADLALSEDASLTFKNWYSLEKNADYGRIEILKNGSWQKIADYTGGAGGWETQELLLPKEAEKIRFIYKTDGSVNGRGWYIQDSRINDKELFFSINQWESRDY
ncbi:CubicO group peptidase (beta-lactamase class C family) [Peribacillus deserti]|uniref:CubicO group peptidase (Beta-lactamase class C family) n=1 Tax=Peribacillus deserti TaxID=673318 RepID=A0ABS2QG31_9BACI|nr:serine hydrolase domain-containing protein [Peribacillus deserti]MBM7692107.1 CubicO group peptidase (beta-lactamase class C family) [Peribacillus deserti]